VYGTRYSDYTYKEVEEEDKETELLELIGDYEALEEQQQASMMMMISLGAWWWGAGPGLGARGRGAGPGWVVVVVVVGKRHSPSEQRRAKARVAHNLAEAEAEEEARLAELLAQNLLLEELGEERMSFLTHELAKQEVARNSIAEKADEWIGSEEEEDEEEEEYEEGSVDEEQGEFEPEPAFELRGTT
jgi:hypothetical protein